jgi:hypothetical protein
MPRTTYKLILYRPVISYMRSWEGDIGRSVSRLADEIAAAQKALAPVKTGKLKASIRVGTKGRWARGIAVNVGANPGRGGGRIGTAMWTDQGTRPHRITPRPTNRHGYLVFFWPKAGRVVRFPSVNHPGIKMPRHWAERGAGAAIRAWH